MLIISKRKGEMGKTGKLKFAGEEMLEVDFVF